MLLFPHDAFQDKFQIVCSCYAEVAYQLCVEETHHVSGMTYSFILFGLSPFPAIVANEGSPKHVSCHPGGDD